MAATQVGELPLLATERVNIEHLCDIEYTLVVHSSHDFIFEAEITKLHLNMIADEQPVTAEYFFEVVSDLL